MDNNNILKIKNTKYTLKESPHFDEQKDEIEILNNIIPDRLTIESDDPNYVLNIVVKSSLENPEKEYRLKIYLNYFYPEKSPRFEFYEINDFLQENRKKVAISRLNKILEENLGFTTIFQLYECAIEFADEEEERRAKIMEEYKKQLGQTRFPLNQMKLYKKYDNIFITDVVVLKNNYLLLASCENKYSPYLRIIDECYDKQLYELSLLDNSDDKKYQFEVKKIFLYNISNTEDELYLLCSDKNIRKYKISYLKSKSKKTGMNISIEFKIKNYYYNFLDMLILKDYNNFFLFLCKDEILIWKQNEIFEVNSDSIINEIPNLNTKEIFLIDKNTFILTNSKNNEILFLTIEDNNIKKLKWGKTIKICCSKNKNYIFKINERNLLFGNSDLREFIIIYIPTGEIVTRYECGILTSIFQINKSIYICQNKGIEEIDFKKVYLSDVENNYKLFFNSISLIKPVEKGYYCFAGPSSFMICK